MTAIELQNLLIIIILSLIGLRISSLIDSVREVRDILSNKEENK